MTITIEAGYQPGALGWVVGLHGAYYHEHWQFGWYFEAKVATELAELFGRFEPTRDGFWLAKRAGRIVGSVTIDGGQADTVGARLRWFIVDPACQGQGIGQALIEAALAFCRQAGFRRVYLTTFAGLDAARHLYERHGFRLVAEQTDNHWGATTREQEFELYLA